MNPSDLVIYVWEGQADIAERVERCVLNMDVQVVRADALAVPPAALAPVAAVTSGVYIRRAPETIPAGGNPNMMWSHRR